MMPAASSLPRFYLQLSCLAGGLVAVAGWQAASTAGDEPPGAKVLRLGATAAAAMLIAQLLLDKESGTGSTIIELPTDSTATLREDWGKSTMAPVHIGRAKTTSSPIVEGTSRTMANTDNPRGLSFLPAATAAAIHPPAAAAPDAAPATTALDFAASFKGGSAEPLPQYTLAEVAKHCTREDAWIIIDERVYDVTRFVDRHPGGVGPLVNLAGKECTDVFANYHAARVYEKMLPAFLIGEMAPGEIVVWPHVADFRRVRLELLRRGLFETDMHFYAKMAAWHAALFLSSLYLSLGCTSCTAHMSGAVLMGVFWQQLAGIGHDLGHSGVTHDFHRDHRIGSTLSALMGLSVGWWKSDHNTHHVACNAIEHDPNIQHMPMLAISPKIFSRPKWWDTYHRKWVGMDDVARLLVSYQHLFFYPLMALGRWNLYVQGLIYLLTQPDKTHYPKTELAGIAVFFSWVFATAWSMPTWAQAVSWVMVSHAVAGVLHVQIVLSHWSMHAYAGRAYTGPDDEWYITTMRTTMNVSTPKWLDFVHIGLQFQVEHHLFPRLPRHNLREARTMVKEVVEKHFPAGSPECKRLFPNGIAYHEPGFFEGNLEMWRTLKLTALAARSAKKGEHGFWQSALWDGMNCAG
jgi:delta8-fatty-acid desaturase